jgi:hypothetical protein
MRSPVLAAALLVAGAIGLGGARPAHAKQRVALPDFKVEGEGTPALALQLQDGFVLGLVRAGIQVLDPVDVSAKLEGHPELAACDSSACLKTIGHILAVRYVLRVKVEVAGNSYRMVARLFSTEGEAPAALPLATKSRTCDVCTVAEARDYMLKLADGLRPDLEEQAAPAAVAPPLPIPPSAPSLAAPLAASMGGALAVGLGIAIFATMPDCHAATPTAPASCADHRLRAGLAGGLMGAGIVTSIVGTVVTIGRAHAPATGTVTQVALTVPF